VSGFAKILAPNWRIGYLAAPPNLVEPLLDTKLLATLTTPALLEKALALCIEQGQLRRHAERIRTRLDAARARAASSWRCKRAALLRQSRWACSAGSIRAWTPTPWPSACWTKATCWRPARCSMPSANPAR
jgi:DNA-binding transcriptional MocR family regulator